MLDKFSGVCIFVTRQTGVDMNTTFNGDKLREKRAEKGLSLRALAGEFYRQFEYTISFQAVAWWEDNKFEPKGHHIVMLARILGVQESFFYE